MMRACFIFFFFTTNALYSQPHYENLVFEGAGMRGLAYAGAIRVLEEKQHLQHIKRVAGTSAGAITACLLALNYSSTEIEELIASTSFQQFNQGRFFFLGGLHRVYHRYGWYRTKRFENWLAQGIRKKGLSEDITLKALHDLGYKDLFVMTTCLNQQKNLCLSYRTFPNMRLIDAVLASMAVPLYFEPVGILPDGTRLKDFANQPEAMILIDGGLGANFPLHIFDTIAEAKLGRTLGIKIDSDEQIQVDKTMQTLAPFAINKVQDYLTALYTFTLETMNKDRLEKNDRSSILALSSCHVSPRVKRLCKKDKNALVSEAVRATRTFFQEQTSILDKSKS